VKVEAMKKKSDFDDIVENALNEENSEEDMAFEYAENEISELFLSGGCTTKDSLMKRISEFYDAPPAVAGTVSERGKKITL